MNRREILAGSFSLGVFGYPLPIEATSPPFVWKENATTLAAATYLKTQFNLVKTSKKVSVLSSDEWQECAQKHQTWANQHSQLGNLHHADLLVQARQTALKAKFGATPVDNLLVDGWHYTLTGASSYIGYVPKMGSAVRDGTPGCDDNPHCSDCKGREAMVISLDIGAFLYAWDPLVAGLFAATSLILAIANYIQC